MRAKVMFVGRVKSEDGTYPFLEVQIKNGRPIPLENVTTYYLRYSDNGRRIVEPVGGDLSAAFVAYQNRELNQARAQQGLKPIETEASALIRDFKTSTSGEITIAEAVAQFIVDCQNRIQDWRNGGANGLSPNSASAYKQAIQSFADACANMGAVNMSELNDPKRGEAILSYFKDWLHR
ncbi:MAG TPA: hypothetical protein VEJ39_06795, partial [Candidatus Acidoferrales bacterium]|nr:hypothetical protein [Candidatus Acidoferrales bacterium]